jgi:hypothetical protein
MERMVELMYRRVMQRTVIVRYKVHTDIFNFKNCIFFSYTRL